MELRIVFRVLSIKFTLWDLKHLSSVQLNSYHQLLVKEKIIILNTISDYDGEIILDTISDYDVKHTWRS